MSNLYRFNNEWINLSSTFRKLFHEYEYYPIQVYEKATNIIHGYEQQYLPCVQSVFLYSVHDKELNVLPSKMTTLI